MVTVELPNQRGVWHAIRGIDGLYGSPALRRAAGASARPAWRILLELAPRGLPGWFELVDCSCRHHAGGWKVHGQARNCETVQSTLCLEYFGQDRALALGHAVERSPARLLRLHVVQRFSVLGRDRYPEGGADTDGRVRSKH